MSTSYRAARTSRASLRRSSLAAGFLAALHASGASHAAQEEIVLAPVTVSAAEEGGLGLKQAATTGSRLRLTPLETPASVDILPGETIRARGDATLIEAAARAPGITQSGTSGGGALAARGFAGNTSVMRLYDGTRMYVSGGTVSFPFDPWMAERMEVLRGPASVLYGEGAIGGAINTIPKKPQRGEIAHEARVAYGSDDTWRTAYGSGGAVDERWSYRFDVSRNRSDGYVDRGGSDTLAAAAAVRLDVSPVFNLTLSHDYGRLQPMRYFGVPLINGK
ncbi:MAG: TonB-dependent receptor plug domain-containing protein, partial [Proteobacteria bacterium]|nr:TonB-dependent receptor plug domain-containing protein [Pseudomonadota bacterium]